MKEVIHQNYYDNDGKIYCKKYHRVMEQNINKCSKCEYCFGSLQGDGVECLWEDVISQPIISISNPQSEYLRVSKLIDKGIIKKG